MGEKRSIEANARTQEANIYARLRNRMDAKPCRQRHSKKNEVSIVLETILLDSNLDPSPEVRSGLRKLVETDVVRVACDRLRDCPAVMSGLPIGNLKKMLSRHHHQVSVNIRQRECCLTREANKHVQASGSRITCTLSQTIWIGY